MSIMITFHDLEVKNFLTVQHVLNKIAHVQIIVVNMCEMLQREHTAKMVIRLSLACLHESII